MKHGLRSLRKLCSLHKIRLPKVFVLSDTLIFTKYITSIRKYNEHYTLRTIDHAFIIDTDATEDYDAIDKFYTAHIENRS